MQEYTFIISTDKGTETISHVASTTEGAKIAITNTEFPKNFIGQIVNIEDVKRGEYVRMVNQKKVWIKQEYNRHERAYELSAFEDINSFKSIKKGKQVLIDFHF